MILSLYLVMILKFCLKLINHCNFTYLANGDYSGATVDFSDNVTIQDIKTVLQ